MQANEKGTPDRRTRSAQGGKAAKRIVAQGGDEGRAFRLGLLLGLGVGLAVLALVVWLWAIPTVEGCTQSLHAIQGALDA